MENRCCLDNQLARKGFWWQMVTKKNNNMKRLILSLLLAPVLLFSQGDFDNFIAIDTQGNEHNLYEYLDQGTTVVIQFLSPSMTCWPSSNSLENLAKAYERYGCNDIQFLIVAQWGSAEEINEFIESNPIPEATQIPAIAGDDGGQLITQFLFPISEAYECWIIRPDGSYLDGVPLMWDLEVQSLDYILGSDEGFSRCCMYWNDWEDFDWATDPDYEFNELSPILNKDIPTIKPQNTNVYDIFTGNIINKPKKGFYIQEGKKYYIIK